MSAAAFTGRLDLFTPLLACRNCAGVCRLPRGAPMERARSQSRGDRLIPRAAVGHVVWRVASLQRGDRVRVLWGDRRRYDGTVQTTERRAPAGSASGARSEGSLADAKGVGMGERARGR